MGESSVRHGAGAETLDLRALQEAFEMYTRTAQSMEESYRRLENRVTSLDAELQEKNRELAYTTEYLRSILESMTDGVIAVNNDGVITTFNRAAGAILGFVCEDVAGRGYEAVFGESFAPTETRCTAELQGTHGAVRVTEQTAPITDKAGAIIGHVMVFQDLREIEALREQVRRKDRLAALGEMAATVAHEIRNPLGGIRGFASLLERDTDDDDPRMRLVRNIVTGTKNLDRVVSELLEYTRPVELDLKRVRLREFVDGAIDYVSIENSGIEVFIDVEPSIEIEMDPDKLRQVFLNIVLNAAQSIEGDGRIAITSDWNGSEAVLSISDSGCGIGEEDLERVFSPFFTTKEKGTGLGLAVAAKIVESHHGRLMAESTPGSGSTFRIYLPRKG